VTLDPDVPEAVRAEPGFEDVARCGDHDLVDLAERQPFGQDRQVDVEMRRGQVPVAVAPFAVRQRQPPPGRPGCGQPHPPVDVLPEIHHEGVPVAPRPYRDRPDLLHPPGRSGGDPPAGRR